MMYDVLYGALAPALSSSVHRRLKLQISVSWHLKLMSVVSVKTECCPIEPQDNTGHMGPVET